MTKSLAKIDYTEIELRALAHLVADKEARSVLVALANGRSVYDADWYFAFSYISACSDIPTNKLPIVMSPLRHAGMVEFRRGLFNEDGQAGGSGYRITDLGLTMLEKFPLSTLQSMVEDGNS